MSADTDQLGRRAFLATLGYGAVASGLGRLPYGGTLRLSVPWDLRAIDPHALDDPAALWFAEAIADPLFALDATGRPYPALAAALPRVEGTATLITLRPDLRTARGRSIDARDAVWSILRARRFGAAGLLAGHGAPKVSPGDPLRLEFPKTDALKLATALSSPIAAILPRAFSASSPDGTGGFRAEHQGRRLTLHRNPNAARGPALLDAVGVAPAELAAALRAFEAGSVDVGWLGAGLHLRRSDSVPFQGPVVGWVVLRTGSGAGRWGAPGIAQQLADALPASGMRHLGLSGASRRKRTASTWQGPATSLFVDADSPYLVEVATVVAASLSRPAHEITMTATSQRELSAKKRNRSFALMVDIVRRIGPTPEDTLVALLTADDPRLALHTPIAATRDPAKMTRSLRLGIIGALRPRGAHSPEIHRLDSWDLAQVWRRSSRTP